ncbi:MAG: dimethyladenosine transferase [Frankiales bacterium]|nr:dimethyladenosine transferase [Frankiales bacterium]
MSRSTVVPAPTQAVFDLLADPGRHAEIDGSGTVKGRLRGPSRLSAGARFGMRMRLGVPYPITNTVVEFEEGRRIAWRHLGHHVWRYELEPVPEGTRVTETFDWAPSRAPRVLELLGIPEHNARSIDATLVRLRSVVGA